MLHLLRLIKEVIGVPLARVDFSTEDLPVVTNENPNLMCSGKDDLHYPVLDIDFFVHAFPSSTNGHSHLVIQKPLTATEYQKLLDTLVEVGIVQKGYADQLKKFGYTCVRLPWIAKEDGERDS